VNFEAILNYFTHHVESIIQWLFLLILALTGFLISRGLLKKQDSGAAGASPVTAGPSPELEAMLKTILDRTNKLEAVAVTGMSPEAAALAETQVQSLKKELAAREEEMKALKASGGGGKVTEEAQKLTTRLKELETKLAEYEILEDDIADLSLYKEENVRLRSELDKIKGGGAASAPAPAAPEPTAAPAPPAPDEDFAPPVSAAAAATANPNAADDIVAEFAQAVSAEATADANDITMQVPDTGDPMNDFEAAVKIEKKMNEGKAPEAAPAAPAPAAAAAAKPASGAVAGTPPAKAAPPKGEADDLFAEFGEAPADEGALDTDKMMAEMAALVSIEPAGGSSLDEGIDTDKMAAEAGNFQKR